MAEGLYGGHVPAADCVHVFANAGVVPPSSVHVDGLGVDTYAHKACNAQWRELVMIQMLEPRLAASSVLHLTVSRNHGLDGVARCRAEVATILFHIQWLCWLRLGQQMRASGKDMFGCRKAKNQDNEHGTFNTVLSCRRAGTV